ncbi:TOTE conflict system archaeo-eukaryotic primase domain-containing protein [Mesorhizobium sp. CA16]|uniref:TOTE conflict system archaeo-eukaryotic primase domain-containing protein n=1 Tax=Mesorhizobium sp. CA16 TaxID=588496 RepID=UPI001CCEF9AF|nr:hypothetical protein [Mesorhizobium sp. CA16]MBZ9914015.1 hypothetical protein [Mesorhizobium sp. CA16]
MDQFSDDPILALSKRFDGYEKAYGVYATGAPDPKGKVQGKAQTVHEPITVGRWRAHVEGNPPGIGIIPLKQDNTVVWGVIDIDIIGIDHKALEAKITQLKLPLIVFRSKSGGAHCFLFTKEPVAAGLMVEKLTAIAAALGHGGCEIFPKQTSRHDERDTGNWLNMPYFYAERTNRYAIKDGEVLSLPAFLARAADTSVTEAELAAIEVLPPSAPNDLLADAPPCLQFLHAHGGFPDGTRNDGMYNVGVYLKKRFSDDWKDKLTAYNAEMCDPPLTLDEVNTIAKSVSKKDYFYRCGKPPIKDYCDRAVCKTRACGIGDSGPELGQLTKYMSDPVLWFLEIDGKRVMLETRELMNQKLFQEKVGQEINRYLPTLPQAQWERKIDTAMRNCTEEPVPEEASTFGQFKSIVHMYCRGQARTTTKAQLAESHSPFITGDGEVWFKAIGLRKYLDVQGFKFKSMHHVFQMLRDMGCVHETLRVKPGAGGTVNVWVIKEDALPPESEDEPALAFGSGTIEF